MTAKKITREEANEIILSHQDKPIEQVVICYAGQWYDIRGMDNIQRWNFIHSLINKDTKVVNIKI